MSRSITSSFHSQQKWYQKKHLPRTVVDQHYQEWLFDQGSLTKKLLKKSNHLFRVEVIQQRIGPIPFSEKKALKISNRRWAVTREVLLYGANTPWVYARTIIPLTSLKGRLRRLHYLGNQSLGEHLFKDPTMKREPIFIAKLSASVVPHHNVLEKTVWGRRSIFRLSSKPLLVSEIFLPDLFFTKN